MATVLVIGLIFAAHRVALFRLFPTGYSDEVRFLAPTATALILYILALQAPLGRRPFAPIGAFVALAFGLTTASLIAGMFACLNTYGS